MTHINYEVWSQLQLQLHILAGAGSTLCPVMGCVESDCFYSSFVAHIRAYGMFHIGLVSVDLQAVQQLMEKELIPELVAPTGHADR